MSISKVFPKTCRTYHYCTHVPGVGGGGGTTGPTGPTGAPGPPVAVSGAGKKK